MQSTLLKVVLVDVLVLVGGAGRLLAQGEIQVNRAGSSLGGALKQEIVVNVDNLSALLGKTPAGKQPVLFLDGREIKGVFGAPRVPPAPGQPGVLVFKLERNADNRDAWKPLLSQPTFAPKSVSLSVGVPDAAPERTTLTDFQLTVLHGWWFALWSFGIVIAGLLFVHPKTGGGLRSMLRESGPLPAGAPAGATAAYSLGRCQMAFWFVLVVAAYILLYMVTWDMDTVTQGTLALIGISAGTAFSGALVDTSKNAAMVTERTQLNAELAAAAPPNAARQAEINSRILEINKQTDTPLHISWVSDLLTDANGISLHRMQVFVWTIVLGVIFAVTVYNDLLMPDFSATLLGLMGISSGTYVGFKFPENKN